MSEFNESFDISEAIKWVEDNIRRIDDASEFAIPDKTSTPRITCDDVEEIVGGCISFEDETPGSFNIAPLPRLPTLGTPPQTYMDTIGAELQMLDILEDPILTAPCRNHNIDLDITSENDVIPETKASCKNALNYPAHSPIFISLISSESEDESIIQSASPITERVVLDAESNICKRQFWRPWEIHLVDYDLTTEHESQPQHVDDSILQEIYAPNTSTISSTDFGYITEKPKEVCRSVFAWLTEELAQSSIIHSAQSESIHCETIQVQYHNPNPSSVDSEPVKEGEQNSTQYKPQPFSFKNLEPIPVALELVKGKRKILKTNREVFYID